MSIQVGNPFGHAFEVMGRVPQVVTDEVNSGAFEALNEALVLGADGLGKMVVLRAASAGFGKTHLLARVERSLEETHLFIPLQPVKGKELDANSVLYAVLQRFLHALPENEGLTVLDLLARRLFAFGLKPLVSSGEVPCESSESVLWALQTQPVQILDFYSESAVTARWVKENFELLRPRLADELVGCVRSNACSIGWWLDVLFSYSVASADDLSERGSALFDVVFSGVDTEAHLCDRLLGLLNLLGLVTSPVLVLDETEGFSNDVDMALEVVLLLNTLHQSCDRLAVVVSVNDDVWQEGFAPCLSSGLEDRLSDVVIGLEPMGREEAVKMLCSRVGEMMGKAVAKKLSWKGEVLCARGVMRAAAKVWSDVVQEKGEQLGAINVTSKPESSIDSPFSKG